MADLKDAGTQASYLSISSRADPAFQNATFNSASFDVVIPNSTKLNNVSRICLSSVTIPRMFPNIDESNNRLVWWKREVIEIPTAVPDYWLRTVSPMWTAVNQLTLPVGIFNIQQLLPLINAACPADEVWSYDSTARISGSGGWVG